MPPSTSITGAFISSDGSTVTAALVGRLVPVAPANGDSVLYETW
jgi:hypothetical protein